MPSVGKVWHCLARVPASEAGISGRRFLESSLTVPGSSRLPQSLLHRWLREKQFTLVHPGTGSTSPLGEAATSLPPGSCLVCRPSAAHLVQPVAPSRPVLLHSHTPAWVAALPQLHSCPSILALSKPAGVASQSGGKEAHSIEQALPHLDPTGRLRLVHRLDTCVSGVLLLARTLRASRALAALFKASSQAAAAGSAAPTGSSIAKGYIGLVATSNPGLLSRDLLGRDSRVALDPISSDSAALTGTLRAGVHTHSGTLEEGVTRFAVACRAARAGSSSSSSKPHLLHVLFLQPLTGKRHQLRQHVHRVLCGAKGGLLADGKYGGVYGEGGLPSSSIGLHAAVLRIEQEAGQEEGEGLALGSLHVQAPLPKQWQALLAQYGLKEGALLAGLEDFLGTQAPNSRMK